MSSIFGLIALLLLIPGANPETPDIAALESLAPAPIVLAQAKTPGNWAKTGDKKGQDWVQINIACRQKYWCLPKQDVMYGDDKKLVSTPNEWTTGTCVVGGGGVDSCNHCLTSPPEEPCEWWLEPK